MKVFWTSIFWIIVFCLAVFYVKNFDNTLGTQVASWIAPNAVTSTLIGSGTEDPLMTGLLQVQEDLTTMKGTIDMIASKLWITTLVVTGDVADVADMADVETWATTTQTR